MSLKDRITEDMKTAMRAKDAPRLLTIRGLLAALQAARGRRAHRRSTTPRSSRIVDKLVKQRKDSIAAVHAGRPPATWSTRKPPSSKVLEGYLPQRLGADEIAAEVAAHRRRDSAPPAPATWAR